MIRLDNLTKVFETPNGPVTAVDHVSFEVPEGEICILLGPSGCGKTTTMKMVNRLIAPSSGKVFINGRDTDDYDPIELRRGIGYVIQQIGLFPNMTVEENICVVPDLLGWDRRKARARAAELLTMVGLAPDVFLRRYPKELSGGQQQRVGVVRALAADPPVMLMDEPFGAIDPINREVIQDEFLKIQRTLRKTVLFVSHDIDEAVKMADRIAIFRDGRLEQFGSPDEVLARPANGFVEDFVGSDRTLKRLRLLTVAEAMDRNAQTVRAEDPLEKAAAVMAQYGYQNIVLVDGDGLPRGYLHLADIEGRQGICRDYRQALPTTVETRCDLRTAVSEMFTHNVTWLACVDGAGAFRGYVTNRGITHLLGDPARERRRKVPA